MYDIIIIGGGISGRTAAVAAWDMGITSLLVLEQSDVLGQESEGAALFGGRDIPYRLQTVARRMTTSKSVTVEDRDHRRHVLEARAIVLATGGENAPESMLTDGVHLLTDPITGGAVVDQHRQSEIAGIFVCGNALHPHDTEKMAALEGEIAGKAAANYILGKTLTQKSLRVLCGENVRYAVPQCITAVSPTTFFVRPDVSCPRARIRIGDGERNVAELTVADVDRTRLIPLPLRATALRTASGDTLTIHIEPLI